MSDQSKFLSQTGTSARTARPSRPCSTSSVSTRSTNWPPRRSRRASWTSSPTSGAAPGLDRLPPAASEAEALAELRALADSNTVAVSMIGQGYYDTLTPPVLLRNIMENPAWYTAYTPYQPEISQGRLEALLNFQTMVTDLTGLEIANASMLDEGTAAAEAMTLMHRAVRGPANRLAVDVDVFAQTAAVLATRAKPLGIEIVTADLRRRPARRRVLRRHRPAARGQRPDHGLDRAGARGPRPRRAGRRRRRFVGAHADHAARRDRGRRRVRHHPKVRCANGIRRSARRVSGRARQTCPSAAGPTGRGVRRQRRRAGVPLGAADPRAAHPPRQGDQQHLHRTGAAGGDGRDVRQLPRRRRPGRNRPPGACPRRDLAAALGDALVHDTYFDTVLARVPGRADEVVAAAKAKGINLWRVDADHVSVACDEATTDGHVAAVLDAFGVAAAEPAACRHRDSHVGVPDPSRVQPIPHRDVDDALPASAGGQGYRLGPQHDSARLMHDEAQRRRRDGVGHLAGIRASASFRTGTLTHRGCAGSSRDLENWLQCTSPGTTPSRCNPMRVHRGSTPACWRSTTTTPAAVSRTVTSA